MKQYFYILFFLTLVIGCTPDDDEAQTCADGDLAGLRCALSQTSWKIGSVRSDVARTEGTVSTTDWLAFQPDCYTDVTITIPGFIEDGQQEVLANFQLTGDVGSCDDRYLFSLETSDYLQTADVLYREPFSLFMFGDSLATFANVSERWYDIDFTEEVIDFTVDKTIDSTDYRVDVTLVRSR